ncbi:hypothetical protein HDU76_013579 [Blyttiomyces sp. JEL0837]|nr:hypothetical protein HDU76_013579 [Blyttiomyces sp. JEL0837]
MPPKSKKTQDLVTHLPVAQNAGEMQKALVQLLQQKNDTKVPTYQYEKFKDAKLRKDVRKYLKKLNIPYSDETFKKAMTVMVNLDYKNVPNTMENFHSGMLLSEAKIEIDKRDPRIQADICQSIYDKYPTGILSVDSIRYLGDIFVHAQEKIPATESDIAFLKRVEKNKDSLLLNRILAAYALAFIYWGQGDQQACAQRIRKALQYESKMTDEERDGFTYKDLKQVRVSEILEHPMDVMKGLLEMLECIGTNGYVNEAHKEKMSETYKAASVSLQAEEADGKAVSPEDAKAKEALLETLAQRAVGVGGSACNWCKREATKLIGEGGGSESTLPPVKLKQCSRCLRAWYCSTECQRAAWSGGHKKCCRVPYVFRTGDFVVLREIEVATLISHDNKVINFKAGETLDLDGVKYNSLRWWVMVVLGALDGDIEDGDCTKDTLWKVESREGLLLHLRGDQLNLFIPLEEHSSLLGAK